ncbi:MAG TPA: hypothetical protein VKT82_21325 [Ktedonobacterales bacterium]|nr:hypothetical protein [Ktedonobacterales bacterium]
MSSGYPNQPPYPGAVFPAPQPPTPQPDKPGRPWPLGAVNRWMIIGALVITLVAVAQAILASQIVSKPPATDGMTLAYQSSLTQNDGGTMRWAEGADCQFTSSGYVATAPNANQAISCPLGGSSYQNFTLRVTVVYASEVAIIGFLGDDRLAITGTGRFSLYRLDSSTQATSLYPQASTAGSAALHPTDLGVSDRVNDITIQVVGTTYSFYANGQLLTTYTASAQEVPGSISLGASSGQAEFSDIAIYTPR